MKTVLPDDKGQKYDRIQTDLNHKFNCNFEIICINCSVRTMKYLNNAAMLINGFNLSVIYDATEWALSSWNVSMYRIVVRYSGSLYRVEAVILWVLTVSRHSIFDWRLPYVLQRSLGIAGSPTILRLTSTFTKWCIVKSSLIYDVSGIMQLKNGKHIKLSCAYTTASAQINADKYICEFQLVKRYHRKQINEDWCELVELWQPLLCQFNICILQAVFQFQPFWSYKKCKECY